MTAISKDPVRFSSARGGTNIEDYEARTLSQIQLLMLNMDPPQHTKFRRLVSTGFTPRMIAGSSRTSAQTAAKIVDRVAKRGSATS